MKRSPKKIDPSILLAFHELLHALKMGHTVFLLSNMDMFANSAMSAYSDELQDDVRADKDYVKKVRKLQQEFAEQKLASITFIRRTPYPQELAKSRRFLRKLVAEIQDEKQGGEI